MAGRRNRGWPSHGASRRTCAACCVVTQLIATNAFARDRIAMRLTRIRRASGADPGTLYGRCSPIAIHLVFETLTPVDGALALAGARLDHVVGLLAVAKLALVVFGQLP